MAATLAIEIPIDLIEVVATRAAQLVAQDLQPPEPWIGVNEAAAHLACPRSRIYRLVSRERWSEQPNPIPFQKDGSRLLFRRSALDEWVARGGALT